MGLRAEFTFKKVAISTTTTKTFSTLGTPDEGGTLPTFTVKPLVKITRIYKDRQVFIKDGDITTTTVKFTLSGMGDPAPIDIDFTIESRETTTPTAGAGGTAVVWPYYCSDEDVKDELLNLDFGSNTKLDPKVLITAILNSYSEINAAASKGGYDVPFTNSNKTTISAGVSASLTDVRTIGVTDDTIFSVGNTAFLHGQTSNTFNAEFFPIVNADSGADTIVALFLKNAYNSGSTIEKCTEGFLFARNVNAKGAALKSLRYITVRTENIETKIDAMREDYEACLEQYREGELSLDGMTSGKSVIINSGTEDSDVFDDSIVHTNAGHIY